MKRNKRFLSMLLALCLVLGLLPSPAFAANSSHPFTDVSDNAWYSSAVQYVYERDMMVGTSNTEFSPENPTSRGMIVTILHRIEDTPSATGMTFADVPTGQWYTGAVAWASANGIVSGYDNGNFGPNDSITREQMAAILYRYAEYKKYDTTVMGSIGDFSDRGQISPYAVDAMRWTVGVGLISGIDYNTLSPGGFATRAQASAILMRFCENVLSSGKESTPAVEYHTVTFEYNYGNKGTYNTVTVEHGKTVDSLTSPTRSGYTFNGWYTAASGGSKFDFSTAVNSDLILYAHWTSASGGGGGGGVSPVPTYTVSFDLNYEGATGTPASQTVKQGEYAQEPDTPTREDYMILGWYLKETTDEETPVEIPGDLFDFSNTRITENITLYAYWISTKDTDGDGLADAVEIMYGTRIDNVDTDGDGLSDYLELVILGTDPINTDNSAEDSDGDGLTNIAELSNAMYQTNPGDKDTDGDGLTDSEEIYTYGTDPTNYDTDGDGISDGMEVLTLKTDPNNKNDPGNKTFPIASEYDVGDTVVPSVGVSLSGDQIETLSVSPVLDSYLFPENMGGYMGKAYNFSVEGEFDSAVISFKFDAYAISADAEPTIFYFNEEDQTLEELPTTINGNVASAIVNHFSTYVLIDRTVFKNSFQWEDIWDTEGTYTDIEIVFVIDDSGSMDWNDPSYERLSVARELIDRLPDDSKIGLVRFDDISTAALTPQLTTDKEAVKDFLTTNYFYSPGGTDMYYGIQQAFPLYKSSQETTLKMMIVLSDGDTFDTDLHDSVVAEAIAKNIKIYTVGLGTDSTYYFNSYLKPLADNTGGLFYLAAQADELADIYEDITKQIDVETDSDGDGIPDYYEDHMVAFNGMPIKMDKTKKDTDGDGLSDGEEVEIKLVYNEDRTKVYVKGKLNSYPDKVDSDNDGINDPDDPKPMEYTITDRTLAFVEGLSYTNLHSYEGKTLGYALDKGVELKGISSQYAEYLRDAVIIHANNSAVGYWKDFWDSGLGSVALKITTKSHTSVIYALRGTEFGDDFANDFTADVVLGVGWDCEQSRNAFAEYKSIATNSSYDYYVTGHSLGGRLAQDVLYKIYNANEGGWFTKPANIPTPVHSATFNALGYNKLVYMTLENDVLGRYKNKLTNFYYWLDVVGEGFGHNTIYTHAGTDVELLCRKIDGSYYRDKEFDNWVNIRDATYHGIAYFQSDYDLLYTSPHSFSYWVK